MAKTPCERLGAKTRILGVANLAGFLWALFSQGPAVEIDSASCRLCCRLEIPVLSLERPDGSWH